MVRKSTSADRRSSITCRISSRVLAKTDHDARLREHLRIDFLGALQQPQRMEVARARPDARVEPGHRFEVVVEHVRPRRDDDFERAVLAQKIRRQDFDRRRWRGARIAVIVSAKCRAPPSARSSRSTDVMTTCSRPSLRDRIGDALRLAGVERPRQSGRDVAERAGARADRAHDHHRRVALLPALADVRAARLLAHRMQAVLFDDAQRFRIRPRSGRPGRATTPAWQAAAYPALQPFPDAAASMQRAGWLHARGSSAMRQGIDECDHDSTLRWFSRRYKRDERKTGATKGRVSAPALRNRSIYKAYLRTPSTLSVNSTSFDAGPRSLGTPKSASTNLVVPAKP